MRRFAVVRPYDDRFRARVFRFVQSLGFTLPGEDFILPAGASDSEVRPWLEGLPDEPALLVIPFHQHESRDGDLVDGIGACLALPSGARQPILMPISDFAHSAAYPRRSEVLRATRPDIFARLVLLPPGRLGSPAVHDELRSIDDPTL